MYKTYPSIFSKSNGGYYCMFSTFKYFLQQAQFLESGNIWSSDAFKPITSHRNGNDRLHKQENCTKLTLSGKGCKI